MILISNLFNSLSFDYLSNSHLNYNVSQMEIDFWYDKPITGYHNSYPPSGINCITGKENEKIIHDLKSKIALSEGDELIKKVINIKNYAFLAEILDNQDTNQLREMIDKLKNILESAVIILCSIIENKISFAVGVTDNLTDTIDAGEIAKLLGEKVGGKGGGRKNMAMGGGTEIKKISEAMSLIQENLKK